MQQISLQNLRKLDLFRKNKNPEIPGKSLKLVRFGEHLQDVFENLKLKLQNAKMFDEI